MRLRTLLPFALAAALIVPAAAESAPVITATLHHDAGTDIAEDSAAFDKGLRAGDIIAEAGQERVETIADFEAQIEAAQDAGRKSVLLLIRRDGDPRFVALGLDN